MKLLLVRHGRTIANIMGALDTAFPGNPLDATGLAQAASLPGRLEEMGVLGEVSGLWVSPIQRARQTIAPIERATGLTARISSGLREVLAGDLEMHTGQESVQCYIDTTRSWMVGRLHARLPGSPENGVDTVGRFDAVVEEIWQRTCERTGGPDGTALLVAHGTILRLWTCLRALGDVPGRAAEGLPEPAWVSDHSMRNTAITVVEGQPGAWRLVSWNDGEWQA